MSWRDEVIRMAREAGYVDWLASHNIQLGSMDSPQEELERFAALVAEAEWERCAKVCDESEIPFDISVWINSTKRQMTGNVAHALADMIRALKDGEE